MLANFNWLVPGRIAGMGQPGGWGYVLERNGESLAEDLEALRREGVRAVVSLTEEPLPEELLRQRDMLYLHLPVEEMGAPTLDDIAAFIRFAEQAEREGRPLVVHCRAGLGRTGTFLAAYLVRKGTAPRQALAQVRQLRPGSVETPVQEAVIFAYAAQLRSSEEKEGD